MARHENHKIRLSSFARSAVRSAITNSTGWEDYRKRTGVSIARMGRDDCLKAAATLGIDVGRILRRVEREAKRAQQVGRRDGPPLASARTPLPPRPVKAVAGGESVSVDRDLFSGHPIILIGA